ncbi:hypothetical protein MTO96_032835 [Rhipicephalus appendiculatus]
MGSLHVCRVISGGRGEEGSEASRAGSWRFSTGRSPPPEVVGQLSRGCGRQPRVLEETQAEAREHHRELIEEVRGMRSAQERIATALERLLGALVPGIAVPAPPSQLPPSPQP